MATAAVPWPPAAAPPPRLHPAGSLLCRLDRMVAAAPAAPAAKMVGTHKTLVALFVVLKLVELGLARDSAHADDEEYEYDETIDEEAAPAWARAYACANLAGYHSR